MRSVGRATAAATLAFAALYAAGSPAYGQEGGEVAVRELLDASASSLGLETFRQLESLSLAGEGLTRWAGQGASPLRPVRYRRLERRED